MKRRYFIGSLLSIFGLLFIFKTQDEGIHTVTIQPPEVDGVLPPPKSIRVSKNYNYENIL